MTKDSGALSIDFIVGFTIFLIAFIWVVSLVPGLLINLQGFTIDYDAVAYRTGVILVEDPGDVTSQNLTSPWESQTDKDFIAGLVLQYRGILQIFFLRKKWTVSSARRAFSFIHRITRIRQFLANTHYRFNISLHDEERNLNQSIGDVLPEGYGYIRRLVKIKGVSNATIDKTSISNFKNPDQNVTSHTFSILVNTSELYTKITDPSYQIDPVSRPDHDQYYESEFDDVWW